MKRCTKCGEDKPVSEFYSRQSMCKHCAHADWLERYHSRYRDKILTNQRQRYRNDPEYHAKALARQRVANRQSRYGVDLEQYERMAANQDGRCAICGVREKLTIDHDHETGRVRQLLCQECNSGLGSFQDNAELLDRAADYVEKTAYVRNDACCHLCGSDDRRRLVVDHSHVTGKVRQLLCDLCNLGLGHFCDNSDWMRRAAKYLREHARE